ncbi:MAG: surfeit locus 1 family protein [Nocardioidaceae bacterium]|nr:surfeit locus 1 family protein [Nocardioidaceae bacterium]
MSGHPGALRILSRPPMLLLHVAAVVAVLATVLLGRWQVHVWQEHRQDRSSALVHAHPQPLAAVIGRDDPFPAASVGQPVRFRGTWVPRSTVYVAGRPARGQDGYWMVSALSTCGSPGPGSCRSPSAVPVVLGWTPRRTDAPRAPRGSTTVTGWLQPGEADEPDANPRDDVLPALEIGYLVQRMDEDLYSAYVILSAPASARDGLAAVTPASLPKAPTFTALRNLLYGIEWWFFGGFAVFLWWRWCRDALAAERNRDGEPVDDDVIQVSTPAEDSERPSEAGLPSQS